MEYIGKGVYSVSDAKRLTKLTSRSILRWLRGYNYQYKGERRHAEHLWKPDFDPLGDEIGLSFKDLIEIKFVYEFRKLGLSLGTIREASLHAKQRFGIDHPFCSMQFLTDGRKIFLEVHSETGEKILEELFKRQVVFREIVSPFLKQLEFDSDIPLRWWPLNKKKNVVLDPKRNFGQPIVNREGILTEILAKSFEANDSSELVRDWYNVSKPSLRDAIEYEAQLAA